ncbi:MAG: hypothetical protein ACLP01_27075 [Solirubrobacteraceae bacterium]
MPVLDRCWRHPGLGAAEQLALAFGDFGHDSRHVELLSHAGSSAASGEAFTDR